MIGVIKFKGFKMIVEYSLKSRRLTKKDIALAYENYNDIQIAREFNSLRKIQNIIDKNIDKNKYIKANMEDNYINIKHIHYTLSYIIETNLNKLDDELRVVVERTSKKIALNKALKPLEDCYQIVGKII